MPGMNEVGIEALWIAYDVAVAMHAESVRTLTEAQIRGDTDTKALVEAEVTARRQREEARKKLNAAVATALGPPPEPPLPTPSG